MEINLNNQILATTFNNTNSSITLMIFLSTFSIMIFLVIQFNDLDSFINLNSDVYNSYGKANEDNTLEKDGLNLRNLVTSYVNEDNRGNKYE